MAELLNVCTGHPLTIRTTYLPLFKVIYASISKKYGCTVDLVILACFNFREFIILGLFTKFRIREFSSFF